MSRFDAVMISCEHASHALPEPWRARLEVDESLLESHRGWDAGAAALAVHLADFLDARLLLVGQWSRLLVDLNRSPHNPRRFPRGLHRLDAPSRRQIDAAFHRPYQQQGRDWIAEHAAAGRSVFHLAVHSFTPVLDGKERATDIGLLHATDRELEPRVARDWQGALRRALPNLKVHRNQPYRGNADGYVRWLHGQFVNSCYCGLELEVNQRWIDAESWPAIRDALATSLRSVLDGAADPQ